MSQDQTEVVKFVLRLPPVLHGKTKRRAKANKASMNKEIVNIMEEAFKAKSTDKTLNDLVRRLEAKNVI